MCGRKHFHFCQKYCPHPQASAQDPCQVLPLAVLAVRDITTFKCLQLSAMQRSRPPLSISLRHIGMRLRTHPHCPLLRMRLQTHSHMCSSVWRGSRACSRKRSCPHISAALTAHNMPPVSRYSIRFDISCHQYSISQKIMWQLKFLLYVVLQLELFLFSVIIVGALIIDAVCYTCFYMLLPMQLLPGFNNVLYSTHGG